MKKLGENREVQRWWKETDPLPVWTEESQEG